MISNDCKTVTSFLTAYMHGELDSVRSAVVESHSKECAACRAKLSDQQNALQAVTDALKAVPVPIELSNHRWAFLKSARPKKAWGMFWYSPRFSAVLLTAACSAAFLLGATLISVRSVIYKNPTFHYVRLKPDEQTAPKISASISVPIKVVSENVSPQVYGDLEPVEVAESNLDLPFSNAVIANLKMDQRLILSKTQLEELRKLGIEPADVEEIDSKAKIIVAGNQGPIEVNDVNQLGDVLTPNVMSVKASADQSE